jgi:hypothetical protein
MLAIQQSRGSCPFRDAHLWSTRYARSRRPNQRREAAHRHSSPIVTLNVYSHAIPKERAGLTDRLANLFSSNPVADAPESDQEYAISERKGLAGTAKLVGRAGLEPATNGLKDRVPIGPKYLTRILLRRLDCGKQLPTTGRKSTALLRGLLDFPHIRHALARRIRRRAAVVAARVRLWAAYAKRQAAEDPLVVGPHREGGDSRLRPST